MTADDGRSMLHPPHPGLDTLADLHAGVLNESTAGQVRQHLSGCRQCAEVVAALDAVQADLHALPTPPVPAAVVARLDATLADLHRQRPTAADGGEADRSGTGRPAGAAAERGRPDAVPAAAAAGTERREGDPTADGRRPASGDKVADLTVARDRRRRRIRLGVGAAAAAVAVLAAGASVTALVQAGRGSNDDAGTSAAGGGAGAEQVPAAPDSRQSGASGGVPTPRIPSYDRTTLRSHLPAILAHSTASLNDAGSGGTGAAAGEMADAARRTACAGTIRGSTGELTGVLRIQYEGRPAYLFIFADGDRRTAYVVSSDCGTSPALPAAVLDRVP